jgi:stage II sporulation protein AA (anti-sigma F factor antagonist)
VLADVTWRAEPGYAVVTVTGEVDVATADQVAATLGEAGGARSHVVVDITGIDFIGSTGVNLLVTAHKKAHAVDGWLRLVYVDGIVAKILRATGLDDLFPAYGTVEDAVRD